MLRTEYLWKIRSMLWLLMALFISTTCSISAKGNDRKCKHVSWYKYTMTQVIHHIWQVLTEKKTRFSHFPECNPIPLFTIKIIFPGIWISNIKIRQSWDPLICIMGIPVLVRQHLYTETVPIRGILGINNIFRNYGIPLWIMYDLGNFVEICKVWNNNSLGTDSI